MRIAILGATSQIAKDLVVSFSKHKVHDLFLYARQPEIVGQWLEVFGLSDHGYKVANLSCFGLGKAVEFDAIINFIGAGNPMKIKAMGASIFEVTAEFDQYILEYLRHYPSCRYLFLSSGAVYGSCFDEPVDQYSKAKIPINNPMPQDWYAIAKLYAECRHRSLAHLSIVDIRVFSYVSPTQNIAERFLITDIIRAIQTHEILTTSSDNIIRDYIGPDDFHQLISVILSAEATNDAFDCYTKAPIDKFTLLSAMQEKFGLKYETRNIPIGINATGQKVNYYSKNYKAEALGFTPTKTSLDTVLSESELMINQWNIK